MAISDLTVHLFFSRISPNDDADDINDINDIQRDASECQRLRNRGRAREL